MRYHQHHRILDVFGFDKHKRELTELRKRRDQLALQYLAKVKVKAVQVRQSEGEFYR